MNADTAEDYSQPFYVPIGKGRVNLHTGIRGGYYLPALELKEEEEPKLPEVKIEVGYHPLYKRLNEVNGLLLKFQRELNEHTDIAKAKKDKYSTYK